MDARMPTATPAAPAVFGDRYELQRLLKSGNGVETYLAHDIHNGSVVVLKSIDPTFVPAAVRLRFQHETQVLRQLDGLGLSGLHDAGTADERLFLAQPFVAGQTLERLLNHGALSVGAALRIGIDVAVALDIAHGAGICHRDVKPANIIIDGIDPVVTVTLIDFGFARSARLDESIRDDLVGTVRYLAPESAGLLAAQADERSDLYAVGVVLFECLSGRPPFLGPAVGDLLRQHLSSPVPPLRVPGSTIPRAVEALIERLLRKDPAERYQAASALAADLSALLAAIQAGDPDPELVIGRLDHRHSLTDPTFVGRHVELDSLRSFAGGLRHQRKGLVLLESDSGGGKSRLLAEVAQQASAAGVTVLHGQGVAQTAQRPFTLLHGVADGLLALFEPDEPARLALVSALAGVAPSVVRALPALSGLLAAVAEQDTGPEEFGELRSLAALQQLIRAVAAANRPVLLVLDDCQWADALTVRLLAETFGSANSPDHLGVIAAFRSEEVPAQHPLRHITAVQRLQLGPLPADSMAMLAESMAGPLPAVALETVVRLADGSPFMGAAVLRGMVESGALVPGSASWVVDDALLRDVHTALRAAVFLVHRLELLSEDALGLLSVGAVLGKQFDLDTAVSIAGRPDDAVAIIEDARRRRLLWVDEGSGQCSFLHDKIRESLLARLPDDTRQSLHGAAADALAAGPNADSDESIFDLAYHLDAAGRYADAHPYALAGASLARAQYALDTAVSHYRMAQRAVATDVQTRIAVAEGLGDVLILQGVYAEAEVQLATARTLVEEPSHAAAIDGKLGDLAFKQGDIPTAKARLEGALAQLGRRVPRSETVLFIRLLWEFLVQAAHTLLPSVSTGRKAGRGREVDRLAMRLHSRLAYLYWFHSGKIPCAWSHLRGLNLAERYGPSAELGQAYSEHAPVMTMLPWYSRGTRYAHRSLQIRQDLGDVWGQGQSLGFTGVVHYAATNYEQSLLACSEAIRLLQRTGDQWEVNTASWNMALCLWRTGELERSAEVARDVFLCARSIGDQTAAGVGLSVWTRAQRGLIDRSLIEVQLAKGGEDAQTTAELHLAAALSHRHEGDLPSAAASLRTAIATVHAAGLRQEYIAPVFPWYATVLRELAEAVPAHNPKLRGAAFRRAATAARRSRRWAVSYRNNAPHALREAGLIASLTGHPRRANRLLSRSLAVAHEQGARYEAALTAMALAEIDRAAGTVDGYDDACAELASFEFATADDFPGTLDETPTLSIFDRFATLLTVGRAITAATSHSMLEAAIRDAALTLLRAERCQLVPLSGLLGDRITTQSGHIVEEVSSALLAEVIESGAPAVAFGQAADPSESLLLSSIRSALAAPIAVHGEPVSCLYVTHSEIGQLFGEVEIQLAAFIATVAGAAYEHLVGGETRFRSLAQNSSDVITLVDGEGIVSYQSSALSRVFGFAVPGFVGQPVLDWVHPEDIDLFRQALTSAGEAGDVRIESRFQHADGTFRIAETGVTNLLMEPTVAAIVLNTRDITDRRRAEQLLVEKTIALEKADQAKDMFLAGMSHELRTPLTAILGFTSILLMEMPGPLNDEQVRHLSTVERNGKHLLTIINDLLDLTKINSGAVEVSLESVDCGEVAASVASSLRPLAAEKGLELLVELPETAVIVQSDVRTLSQILINLVNNAIKFTDHGHVQVIVEPAHDDAAGSIRVSDTGPGIPADDLGQIFNAFERTGSMLSRSKEGTGLGLHISRKLAELIGAEVTVETEYGAGSTFTVTLRPDS